MATPATIIGQIQPTPIAPGAVPQVAGSPSQLQQINQPLATAQGIPLPASVPNIKQEALAEVNASLENSMQNVVEGAKDNRVDGKW